MAWEFTDGKAGIGNRWRAPQWESLSGQKAIPGVGISMARYIEEKGRPGIRCQASPDPLPSEQMGPCGMWARWRHFTRDMGSTDGAATTGSRSRVRQWAWPWLLMAPHGTGTVSVRSIKGRETPGGKYPV